jgi:hypothetical protein
LLWAGFVSEDMGEECRSSPAIFLSEPNPEGYPQWRKASPEFPSTLREIAYVKGRFVVRREGQSAAAEESGTALAWKVVQEILRNAFVVSPEE